MQDACIAHYSLSATSRGGFTRLHGKGPLKVVSDKCIGDGVLINLCSVSMKIVNDVVEVTIHE